MKRCDNGSRPAWNAGAPFWGCGFESHPLRSNLGPKPFKASDFFVCTVTKRHRAHKRTGAPQWRTHMKENRQNTGDFLMQGSILAAAGILVRLIGLLYKIPMTRVLGDEGIGYYTIAYEIYNIGLILSSYSLPLAVSKLIAMKEEQHRKSDATRVFHCGVFVGVLTGGFMTALLLFGANWIASVIFDSPGMALPLRVMTPTILVFAVMGVIRGFFQGHGSMIQTSISQIIEQIVNAIVSVWASWDFMRRFAETENPYSYGAAGGTLGTFVGSLAAFVFLIGCMLVYQKKRASQNAAAEKEPADSYRVIMKLLILTFIPIIMSQFVYQLSGTVDSSMFNILMSKRGFSESERTSLLGIYSGKYRMLSNVPVAIATSLGTSMIPSIVVSRVKKQEQEVRDKVHLTIKFNMLLAIPCASALFFLASPLMQLVFGDGRQITANLMMLGASAVVFFSLSTVTNAVLQGIDQMRKSVTHSAISLAIHAVLLYLMLGVFGLGVYSLVIGNVSFALVVCLLNWRTIGKTLSYHQEVKNTFLLPLCCSIIMGFCAKLVYEGAHAVFHSNFIALIPAAAVGAVVYALLLIKSRTVTEWELKRMPLGGLLLKLMRAIG